MSAITIDPNLFIQYGAMGAVLAWFMWRNEKVITKLTETQDKLVVRIEKICEMLAK